MPSIPEPRHALVARGSRYEDGWAVLGAVKSVALQFEMRVVAAAPFGPCSARSLGFQANAVIKHPRARGSLQPVYPDFLFLERSERSCRLSKTTSWTCTRMQYLRYRWKTRQLRPKYLGKHMESI